MSDWTEKKIEDIAYFNPSCFLRKGSTAKKIPMDSLQTFRRKITGYEISEYKSGPKFMNGDTLVAKITPCLENGKTAYVDILEDKEVAFGSSEFIVLRPKKGNDKLFLYYLSISPAFRKRAISCMEGTSGRKRVNENSLKIQELPIPDLSTQQRIAAVLSSLDAKIELNNRINAELEAMAKTLYDYWFVQFDFPFDFAEGKPCSHHLDNDGKKTCSCKPYKSSGGKMVWNEQLKREIPEGWEVKSLKDILDNVTESVTSQHDINNIPYTPIDSLPMKHMSFGSGENSSEAKTSLILYNENDILIGAMRVYFHRVCIAPFRGITRTTTMVLRPKNKKHLPVIYQICNEEKTIRYASQISVGTQQPYVKWENSLENYLFPYPGDDKLYSGYSFKMNSIVNKVMLLEKENAILASIRDFLLPMLMNGQVKVV